MIVRPYGCSNEARYRDDEPDHRNNELSEALLLMLSVKHKFIFIHIPKTGGNSIHNALRPFSEDQVVCQSDIQDGVERFEVRHGSYQLTKHSRFLDYANELSPTFMQECQLFSCIRNPWERMISYYFSPHRRVSTWSREQFVAMLDNEVKPSRYYLSNAGGEFVNRIHCMRFEHLHRDFKRVCERLNLPEVELPHYNKSVHQQYKQYYDAELIQRVSDMCAFEISQFAYEF